MSWSSWFLAGFILLCVGCESPRSDLQSLLNKGSFKKQQASCFGSCEIDELVETSIPTRAKQDWNCQWLNQLAQLPIENSELFAGNSCKTWKVVCSESKLLKQGLPFDSIAINKDGTWRDSNRFEGIWRTINQPGQMVFANSIKMVRCEILRQGKHDLTIEFHDWAPGLILHLTSDTSKSTKERNSR